MSRQHLLGHSDHHVNFLSSSSSQVEGQDPVFQDAGAGAGGATPQAAHGLIYRDFVHDVVSSRM